MENLRKPKYFFAGVVKRNNQNYKGKLRQS